MASGLAVVATACGGPETAVVPGQTGLLTPVGDVDAFAGGLRRMIDEPVLRKQMGAAGRARAVASFSLAAAARPFFQAYDALVGRPQGPASTK
jgi:glycosyltransferase involved in cell wall biosynthesis